MDCLPSGPSELLAGAQVIESEYAAKYLEFLGASPTQAAQELVRKALPLTMECLQTKLKVFRHCIVPLPCSVCTIVASAHLSDKPQRSVRSQAAGHRHNEVLVVAPSLQYDMLPIQETDPQEVVRLGFIGTLTPQEATPPEDAQVHAPLSYNLF